VAKPFSVPDRRTRLQVAARADVDERSVAQYWRSPNRMRPLYKRAVRQALQALGMADPHPEARP
jgi:hypothetical protein